MIFTLPNMQKWLENKYTNCLYYEHTLYLNEEVTEFLLAKHKFRIVKKHYFKQHSIFYAAKIDENIDTSKVFLKNEYAKNKQLFLNMYDFYAKKIKDLNEIFTHTKKEIYLFGAHLFSQFLLYQGLKQEKIKFILDNDKNKQEKRLYGTKFLVKSPQILKDKNNALLVLNAGAYNEEIKKDILENINESVEILCF